VCVWLCERERVCVYVGECVSEADGHRDLLVEQEDRRGILASAAESIDGLTMPDQLVSDRLTHSVCVSESVSE